MTDNLLNYIIIWVASILAIFSFVMWIEKMIKIIIWNYILTWICLAAWETLNILINFINTDTEAKLIWISMAKLANFLSNSKTTIILLIYWALLIFIYLKSKLSIRLPQDDNIVKWLYFIIVPMTVVSIILTLQIALMWIKAFDITYIQTIAEWLWSNNYAYKFFSLTPLRFFLHGITTILISSELNITLKPKSPIV